MTKYGSSVGYPYVNDKKKPKETVPVLLIEDPIPVEVVVEVVKEEDPKEEVLFSIDEKDKPVYGLKELSEIDEDKKPVEGGWSKKKQQKYKDTSKESPETEG